MSEIKKLTDERTEEESEHFVIEDDQTAEWAMQKIREAKADTEKWDEFYDDRKRKVHEANDLIIANMESLLQTYFEKVPHKVTKTQENYTLPGGKLVLKKANPEYQRDDAEVIAWLKENGGDKYIKVVEKLDWAELKKSLNVLDTFVADENGQIIPCIYVEAQPDVFRVELKKED